MTPKTKAKRALKLLKQAYGERPHVPRREGMHELISTMLSHRTTGAQEDQAYQQMWERFPSWKAIMDAPVDELAEAISPSRFPESKAPRIQTTLRRIWEERGEFNIDFLKDLSVEEGMDWLLSLPGVGVKTASLVLLFCYYKPVLPVDTHVHRVTQRLGVIGPKTTAEKAHELLLGMLPKDPKEIFNFHILLLQHGRKVCTWAAPKHEQCVLAGFCDFYQQGKEAPGVGRKASGVKRN